MDLWKYNPVKNQKRRVMICVVASAFLSTVVVLSPSEGSSVIIKDDLMTVSYTVDAIPQVPDPSIPSTAIEKATAAWEKVNPDLVFVRSGSASNHIKWDIHSSDEHTGLATCGPTLLHKFKFKCTLEVALGEGCNGNYNQFNEKMVTFIIAHEIGHVLGLSHTSDEGHLMWGKDGSLEDFDAKNFVIPDDFRDWRTNQTQIRQQIQDISSTIHGLRAEHEATGVLDRQIQFTDEQYRMIGQLDEFANKFVCDSKPKDLRYDN